MRGNTIRIILFAFALLSFCETAKCGDALFYSRLPKYRDIKFDFPRKSIFFQGEVVMGALELGLRFTAGYNFGRFGIVGGGIGSDGFLIGFTPDASLSSDPYDGWYFPIYVHYSGDILNKAVTPFYVLEAGYAPRINKDNQYLTVEGMDHPVYKNLGGVMGNFGFGVKLYPRHNLFVTISANCDMKYATVKFSNYYYNSVGNKISVSYSSHAFFFIPALKIGVGFNRKVFRKGAVPIPTGEFR